MSDYNPDNFSYSRDDPAWKEHIQHMLEAGEQEALRSFIESLHPADIAHILGQLEHAYSFYLFQILDAETQGEALLEMEEGEQSAYFRDLSAARLADIVREQESDDAADLLVAMDGRTASSVLSRIPAKDREDFAELLAYSENTAGALMSKEFVAVRVDETVSHAISTIRRVARETDDIHVVYVLDGEGKFRGHVTLHRLVLARPQTKVRRIMDVDLPTIPVAMDQEEVAHFFTRYDIISAPVVDEEGRMLGRITVDDILEVQQEEASEDILRMGGVSGGETFTTPLWVSSLKRATWLVFNLFTAMLSASVVRFFEDTIDKVVVLAALMPIVAGMGGNAAGQTLAVVVRNIALGELEPANVPRAIRREIFLGLVNGVLLGLASGVLVFLFTFKEVLAYIMALAMVFNMLVAATSGVLIPLALKRFKIDPAIASTIFVTICTDVLGFFMFLGLAYLALYFQLPGM